MLTHPTTDKLNQLRLFGMAHALAEQARIAEIGALAFEERLGLLIDREMTERTSRMTASRLRRAHLKLAATAEDIDFRSPRGLDRALFQQLLGGEWVTAHQNILLAADKAYDTADVVAACRTRNVTPHVAQNDGRRGGSAIDGRTTRHGGYRVSQTIRKRIEEHFGWAKTVGRIRQTVFRGIKRVDQHFKLTMTASNIVRMARILITVPQGALQ